MSKKLKKAKNGLDKLVARLRKGQGVRSGSCGTIYTAYGKKSTGLGLQAFRRNRKFFDYLGGARKD